MATRSPLQHHSFHGEFATFADLPNSALSPNQTPILKIGDRAYVAATGATYVCQDATPGGALWAPAGTDAIVTDPVTGNVVVDPITGNVVFV